MTTQSRPGRIVTFYSYKGGTGRSMALANVAWILASGGKRVLTIDWDLEAPGLHRYFAPFLSDPEVSFTDGVIDFIIEFSLKAAKHAAAKEPPPADWLSPYANILRYATSLRWEFPNRGSLDLVTAGRQGASYSTRVNSFNWQNFYDVLDGARFLDAVKERLRAEYDYVLIDSRTGISDTSGICTVQMPDVLVVCFTLNNQSIEGAAAVAASIRELRGDSLRILPVPTRTDVAEKERLDLRREYARDKFDALLAHLPEGEREAYWGDLEIPYVAFYAYEEILAAFLDKPEQRVGSILAPSERLAAHVSEGEVVRLSPPTEAQRREVQALFVGEPLISFDLFLTYAQQDEAWATTLARKLARERRRGRKLRTFLPSRDIEAGSDIERKFTRALSKSRKIALILTPDSSSLFMLGALREALTTEPEVRQKLIVLYRGTADIPEGLADLPYIDFRDDANYAESFARLSAFVTGEEQPEGGLPRLATAALSAAPIPRPDFGFVPRYDREGRPLVDVLTELLGQEGAQPVTLWGGGGVGKTALAAETARRLGQLSQRRIVWIAVDDHARFSPATFYDEVLSELREPEHLRLAPREKAEQVRLLLAEEPTLVVLDAFEKAAETEDSSAYVWAEQPPCQFLITSRQRVSFARNVPVHNFTKDEAHEFVRLWQANLSGAVDAIDFDLTFDAADGNPLALKLLLAQTLFSSALPARAPHKPGRGVIKIFDDLCDRLWPEERALLAALALFVPSAPREALAEVAGLRGHDDLTRVPEALARLSALRLVNETDGERRVSLEGAARDMAQAQLEARPEADSFRARFVEHFRSHVRRHAKDGHDGFAALQQEKENVLRAIGVAFAQQDWPGVIEMAAAIARRGRWLQERGHFEDAIWCGEQGLEAAKEVKNSEAAEAFVSNVWALRHSRMEYDKVGPLLERALTVFEQTGDTTNIARSLLGLGNERGSRGDYEAAGEFYQKSLSVSAAAGYVKLSAVAARQLSEVLIRTGHLDEAEAHAKHALSYAENIDDTENGDEERARALSNIGSISLHRGYFEEARQYIRRSLDIWKRLGNQSALAVDLVRMGEICFEQENLSEAAEYYQAGLKVSAVLDNPYLKASILGRIGVVNSARGSFKEALESYDQSMNEYRKIGHHQGVANILLRMGEAALQTGEFEPARRYLEESLEVFERLGFHRGVATVLTAQSQLSAAEGNVAEAARLLGDALSILERLDDPAAARLRQELEKIKGAPS